MIYISFELNIATFPEFSVDPLVLAIPYKIKTRRYACVKYAGIIISIMGWNVMSA